MFEILYVFGYILAGIVVLAAIACVLDLDAPDFTDGEECLIMTVCAGIWPILLCFILGWGLSRLLVIVLAWLIETCKYQKGKFLK